MQLLTDPQCFKILLDLYYSIICSSLSELDDACHTEMVYNRCVDFTTPLSHSMIRCSIDVRELIQRVDL